MSDSVTYVVAPTFRQGKRPRLISVSNLPLVTLAPSIFAASESVYNFSMRSMANFPKHWEMESFARFASMPVCAFVFLAVCAQLQRDLQACEQKPSKAPIAVASI